MSPPPKGATLLPTGFVHWTAPTEAGYFIGMVRDLDPTLIVAVLSARQLTYNTVHGDRSPRVDRTPF
jgi:hypothetical protein